MILAAVAFLALTAVSFRRPGVAIGFVLCTYGIEQALQAHSTWFVAHQWTVNAATGALALVALAGAFSRHDLARAAYPREGWLALALLGLVAFSYVWSYDRAETVEQLRAAAPYLGVFALITPLLLTRRGDLSDAMYTLLVLGTPTLLALYGSRWTGRSIEFSVDDAGFYTLKGNPLAIGSLGGQVAIAVTLMNFRGAGRFWQVARWPIFVIALAVIAKSGSRGQFIGALIAIVALFPVSRRIKNLGGFAALAFGLLVGALLTRYAMETFITESWRWSAATMYDVATESRGGMALAVIGAWAASNPVIWVIGMGSSASFRVIGFYPHVVPAEVLAELGLVGFSLYAWLAVRAARSGWRAARAVADDPVARGQVAALVAMALYNLILSLKSGSLLGSSVYFGLVILTGRAWTVLRAERDAADQEEWDHGGAAYGGAADADGYEANGGDALPSPYDPLPPVGARDGYAGVHGDGGWDEPSRTGGRRYDPAGV